MEDPPTGRDALTQSGPVHEMADVGDPAGLAAVLVLDIPKDTNPEVVESKDPAVLVTMPGLDMLEKTAPDVGGPDMVEDDGVDDPGNERDVLTHERPVHEEVDNEVGVGLLLT